MTCGYIKSASLGENKVHDVIVFAKVSQLFKTNLIVFFSCLALYCYVHFWRISGVIVFKAHF